MNTTDLLHRSCWILILLGALVAKPTPAQDRSRAGVNPDTVMKNEDRWKQVNKNTSRLTVRMTLDRDEYLSGEDIRVTVVVRNDTKEPLEVFHPFYGEYSGLNILWKNHDPNNPLEWLTGDPEDRIDHNIDAMAGKLLLTLQPGEEQKAEVSLLGESYDDTTPLRRRAPPLMGENEFKVVYHYAPAAAQHFRVIKPTALGGVAVLPVPYGRTIGGRDCQGIIAAALTAKGRTYLVQTPANQYICQDQFKDPSMGQPLDLARVLGIVRGFTRVRELPDPAEKLEILGAGPDQAQIRWESSTPGGDGATFVKLAPFNNGTASLSPPRKERPQ